MTHRTFLNEEVAGVLGLQEPFQKVQVHVLNDTVETFQSMPLTIEIESVDGQFSKEISVKTCPQKVTGNYRVVNWTEHQNKRPHLTQCSFAKPANNGIVDLLVGITLNSTILMLVSEGKVVDPSPALDHLGGVALVRLTTTKPRERDLTSFAPCLQKNL